MLQKPICLILLINLFIALSCAIPLSERNETQMIILMSSQLSELNETVKYLRSELERQGALLVRLDCASRNQSNPSKEGIVVASDLQALRAELISNTPYLNNCVEAKESGIYNVLIPNYSRQPIGVACDMTSHGGGWTIILRRTDGSVDFYRDWNAYKEGFGNFFGEFFMGLDKIHALTAVYSQELLVLLEDFEGGERYMKYDEFAIGDEEEQYVLRKVGRAEGTAGDSLVNHRGMKFTTFDRDNDMHTDENCAKVCTGGWWYHSCTLSNLGGKYRDNTFGKGVNWVYFRGWEYSLKKAIMMIRPRVSGLMSVL